jgi:hypothetical protein
MAPAHNGGRCGPPYYLKRSHTLRVCQSFWFCPIARHLERRPTRPALRAGFARFRGAFATVLVLLLLSASYCYTPYLL